MSKNRVYRGCVLGMMLLLSGCADWNEHFEGEVVRAYPDQSIHQINRMADRGQIREQDEDVRMPFASSSSIPVFHDGHMSRGLEDVRRLYIMPYEDTSHHLHCGHSVYVVVKPAEWIVHETS